MLPEGCSSERLGVRLTWEPPSVPSSEVRCRRGRVVAATHGLEWPSFGWRVLSAASWPIGRV